MGTSEVAVGQFVVLLVIAVAVALVTQRRSIPFSVALVVAGFVLTFADSTPAAVPPDLILLAFIPGLVFEAAYHIDLKYLRRRFASVAVLAVPGVVITAAIVGVIVSALTGLELRFAFVLGAIVCATDPVAVVAVFKQLRAPKDLGTVVEAESLLNDGTGVVLYTIAVAAATSPASPADAVLKFIVEIAGSVALGVIAGFIAVRLMHLAEDQTLRVMVSLIGAYGTYLAADAVGLSGIIATVVVGLVIGNAGGQFTLPEATTEALDIVWDSIAYLLTALVFLSIGVAITPGELGVAWPVIVAGYLGITVARAVVVYGLIGAGGRLLGRGRRAMPVGYLHVMVWAGLRGAIAIALVLSLPANLPNRDLITGGVYGVVLITLLVQGTSAGWVVRQSGVLAAQPGDGAAEASTTAS